MQILALLGQGVCAESLLRITLLVRAWPDWTTIPALRLKMGKLQPKFPDVGLMQSILQDPQLCCASNKSLFICHDFGYIRGGPGQTVRVIKLTTF